MYRFRILQSKETNYSLCFIIKSQYFYCSSKIKQSSNRFCKKSYKIDFNESQHCEEDTPGSNRGRIRRSKFSRKQKRESGATPRGNKLSWLLFTASVPNHGSCVPKSQIKSGRKRGYSGVAPLGGNRQSIYIRTWKITLYLSNPRILYNAIHSRNKFIYREWVLDNVEILIFVLEMGKHMKRRRVGKQLKECEL